MTANKKKKRAAKTKRRQFERLQANEIASKPAEQPVDEKPAMTLEEYMAQNVAIWKPLAEYLKTIFNPGWTWGRNMNCKYINIHIDMRDRHCIVKDNNGRRLSPADLAHQNLFCDETNESLGRYEVKIQIEGKTPEDKVKGFLEKLKSDNVSYAVQ